MKRVFIVILFAITIVISTASECSEHNYTIGNVQFLWPRAPSSDIWLATDCLNIEKRLIFRRCLNGTWSPDNFDFQNICEFENEELCSNDCPYNFESVKLEGSFPRTICVRQKGLQYDFIVDKTVCIQDNIFTMELNNEEQTQFISTLVQEFPSHNGLFVLNARWRYPSREISKNIDYEKEDVELHDVRCGRYELPMTFNSIVPVHCTKDICDNLCLYLNATTYPFSRMIDTCSEYVIAKPKNTFLHSIGCPTGYYRIEYDYVESEHNACFSIQMFSQLISVDQVEYTNNLQPFCNGNIMPLSYGDDLFVFRQLSEQLGLASGNYCLFGLETKRLIKYSQWDSSYAKQIKLYNFNWDNTMNYSHINTPDVLSYLAVKPNGQWTWAFDSVSCVVCMVNNLVPSPELQLDYNILERKLVLEVKNQDFLIKEKSSDRGFICFSVFNEVFKSNLTVFPMGYGKYVVEDVGIGQYWCSGHNAINRIHIWTRERIFAYGIWFSFHIERKCTSSCSFSADLTTFLQFFKLKNGFVSVKASTIVEHEPSRSETEYTFIVLLSLTQYDKVINNLGTVVNLTDYQFETMYIYNKFSKERSYDNCTINAVRSAEYCLHEPPLTINAIIWPIARIGETISISSLCPSQGDGSKITRTCLGDYVNGSYWEHAMNASFCYTLISESLLTLLNEFIDSSRTTGILEYLKNKLLENIAILMPVDVFLTSRILQKVSDVTFDDILNLFSIYNSLMKISKDFLAISASSNSTIVLLETFENILINHFESTISNSDDYRDYGNSSIDSPLLKTFVLDLGKSEASGLALYRPRDTSSDDDFIKYSMRFIYPNETVDDLIITDNDLVVGAYIPSDMLTFLENNSIFVTIFFNDKLFQHTKLLPQNEYFETNGKIISIKILGNERSKMSSKIQIFFEINQNENSTCGSASLRSIDGWSSEGCNSKEIINRIQRLALCECTHASYFGYLKIGNTNEHEIHDHALPIIKVIASSFSLFSIFGIFLTAAIFKNWRKEISSKMLINFSFAIALEMFLMILINIDQRFLLLMASSSVSCVTLGSTLHYSILVEFCWMLIFAYYQLKHLNVSYVLLKSVIFGWCVPLLPVITMLIVDHSLYLSENNGHRICHPTRWALNLGVIAPIALISLVGGTNFMLAVISLHRESRNSSSIGEEAKSRMVLSSFLFIILGLTGIFGLLSKMFPYSYPIFSVIFCVLATVHGVLFFLNFMVIDPTVRNLWLNYVTKLKWHLYRK